MQKFYPHESHEGRREVAAQFPHVPKLRQLNQCIREMIVIEIFYGRNIKQIEHKILMDINKSMTHRKSQSILFLLYCKSTSMSSPIFPQLLLNRL